ncbi:MAG: DUF1302 family protein [Thermodesulfobacteriota bacterium]|nr:DUF1302 family protein [Thermodesulfobacteriota bacterium]
MKLKNCLICIVVPFSVFITTCLAIAQVTVNTEGTLRFFTTLLLLDDEDGIFFAHEAGDFGVVKGEARLRFVGDVTDQASYYLRLDFIYKDPSEVTALEDTEGIEWEETDPVDTNVYEAYMNIIDAGTEGLELKIGKQRIKWGSADKLHVIDNLNPNDFANLFTFDLDYFGEKIPVTTMLLTYYQSDWKLESAFIFSPHQASFPDDYWNSIETAHGQVLEDKYGIPISPEIITTSLDIEEDPNVGRLSFGFRFSRIIRNVDTGFSYYKGYLDVPVLKQKEVSLVPGSTSASLSYFYPEMQVVGLDLAGELKSIGYWAEVACFFLENSRVRSIVNTSEGTTVNRSKLFQDLYPKWTVGFDYTFGVGTGLYVNFQYNHGSSDEVGYNNDVEKRYDLVPLGLMGEPEDYFASDIRYEIQSLDLALELFSLIEVADFDDFKDKSIFASFPKVSYKPTDGTKLEMGTTLGYTKSNIYDTKFGMLKKYGFIYFLAELHF